MGLESLVGFGIGFLAGMLVVMLAHAMEEDEGKRDERPALPTRPAVPPQRFTPPPGYTLYGVHVIPTYHEHN